MNAKKPITVGLCETHLWSEISDSIVCPSDYHIFYKNRNKYGGGVVVLVRNDYVVSEVNIPQEYKDVEVCCIDLKSRDNNVRVLAYYRLPYYTATDEQYLDLSLQCFSCFISRTSSPVILMGDFNLPGVDWVHYSVPANPFYKKFIQFVYENGLLQFVSGLQDWKILLI